ncbi:hypothetical protein [Flagellimonas beolgyonensis]|uniref:hypothetical protein n=1 Tax=Flagellimonas beolgyonensis TaxID=864064 RepID=UPI000F8D5181|nr:hypothetical protein [Allomuricauda beolgyonensis]
MSEIDYNKIISNWSNISLGASILVAFAAATVAFAGFKIQHYTKLQSTENQKESDDKLEKLSHPLPNEFQITNIALIILADGLKEFLPDLRKQIEQDKNIFKNYDNNMNVIKKGVNIIGTKRNKKLLSLFENKELYWNMYIMADENQISQGSQKHLLNWIYRDKLSFVDGNCRLSYEVDYTDGNREYFKITMDKSNLDNLKIENTIIYYPNKITSLKELCNKTITMSINVGSIKNGRNINFENIDFRDNYSRTFRLEYKGNYESISKSNMDFMAKTIARINNEMADKTDDPIAKKVLLSMAKNSSNFNTAQVESYGIFKCLSMP